MKYTKTLLLIIFTLGLLGFIAIFLTPSYSFAAEANFTPQVSIGEFIAGNSVPVATDARTIWNYIRAIYKYAIGVVGIVAAVVLMVGGIMWLTAGGNQTRIGEAKAYITASLTGLLLALTSFLILATVNPKLVEFNPLNIKNVTAIGCCEEGGKAQMKSQDNCTGIFDKTKIVNSDGTKCASSDGSLGYCGGTTLCPDDQYCINNKCWDGSINNLCNQYYGQNCKVNLICTHPLTGDGICTEGKNGNPCCVNSDCPNSTNKKCSITQQACNNPSLYQCL